MKKLEERLQTIRKHVEKNEITVMILGLGSVGTYLLDFLVSRNDEAMKIVVVGRNKEKMENNVNIVRVSALIRHVNRSQIVMESGVDFDNVEQIADCIKKYQPDFIVNSSRVYSGLKYGTISWKNLRAYGIWSPLAIKYIRNIMEACELADLNGIVINTSYSDAVIPWLRSAGKPYPDFGSGNMNHLVPRIKYAVAGMENIEDFWNVDVMFATAHFHDVVISKEGQTEGVKQLLKVYYQGRELDIDQDEIFHRCKIAMPTDEKRNMMNASIMILSHRSLMQSERAVAGKYFHRVYSERSVAIRYGSMQLEMHLQHILIHLCFHLKRCAGQTADRLHWMA